MFSKIDLENGDVANFHSTCNDVITGDLRPLTTCQKRFESIIEFFFLDECGI